VISLYYAATPNGQKILLFLYETGLPFQMVPVNLGKGEQHKPEFLAISPNNKIPAIVDAAPADGGAPIPVFESAAILHYLADKTGRFIAPDARTRLEALEWLAWQVANLGPMAGQLGHFKTYAREKIPYAIERYTRELERLFGVLDRRLSGRDYIVGDYSIADMASYPWIVPHASLGLSLAKYPHLERWFNLIRARPATVRAYAGVKDPYAPERAPISEQERTILFGAGPPSASI
jgi:GSH-dependent disulfide-bond oxidoreductase